MVTSLHSPFRSGAFRLPPREFLKRLPVRVSHLVFEKVAEDKDNPLKKFWEALTKVVNWSDKYEPNEPIYFVTDNGYKFTYFKSDDYLKNCKLTSDAVWVVRFEEHNHFITWTFHRYFESSCKSVDVANGGEAKDFLQLFSYGSDDINELLGRTVPGGNIDLVVLPTNKLAKSLNLVDENPYVTKSKVFEGMAEVLISFEVDHSCTEKSRPMIIRGLDGMTEREAGDVIQILLQIEAYRVIATGKTYREASKKMLAFLEEKERLLKQVRKVCQDNIFGKKLNFIKDLYTVEDYLPIQVILTKITFEINDQTEDYTNKYDTAQAYSNLVLDRFDDLRELPIAHEPTIKTHLRHRLAQIEETYKAIVLRQCGLVRELSQLK